MLLFSVFWPSFPLFWPVSNPRFVIMYYGAVARAEAYYVVVGFCEARDDTSKSAITEETAKAFFERAVNASSFSKGGGYAYSLSFIKLRIVEADSPKVSATRITSNAKILSEYLGRESAKVKATGFERTASIAAAFSGRVLAKAVRGGVEDLEIFKKANEAPLER